MRIRKTQNGQHIIREAYTQDEQYRQLRTILIAAVAVCAIAVGALVWLTLAGVI